MKGQRATLSPTFFPSCLWTRVHYPQPKTRLSIGMRMSRYCKQMPTIVRISSSLQNFISINVFKLGLLLWKCVNFFSTTETRPEKVVWIDSCLVTESLDGKKWNLGKGRERRESLPIFEFIQGFYVSSGTLISNVRVFILCIESVFNTPWHQLLLTYVLCVLPKQMSSGVSQEIQFQIFLQKILLFRYVWSDRKWVPEIHILGH